MTNILNSYRVRLYCNEKLCIRPIHYKKRTPQCPFPNVMMGTVMDEVGFDAVMVQFYNDSRATACSTFSFNTPGPRRLLPMSRSSWVLVDLLLEVVLFHLIDLSLSFKACTILI